MTDVHIGNSKRSYLINSMGNFVEICKVCAKWITVNERKRICHGSEKRRIYSCQYAYAYIYQCSFNVQCSYNHKQKLLLSVELPISLSNVIDNLLYTISADYLH